MSVPCETTGCILNATWACTCKDKVYTCKDHHVDHDKQCGRYNNQVEKIVSYQLKKIIFADNWLKELKERVAEESNKLITAIQGACTSTIEEIEASREILRSIKFGKEFDEVTVNNVKTIGFRRVDM